MKILKSLTLTLVLGSVLIYSGCRNKTSDDAVPDQIKINAERFSGEWGLIADGAIFDTTPDSEYNGLTFTVTGDENGGSYTATIPSGASTTVFPATSTWQFCDDQGDTSNPTPQWVLRESDNVIIGLATITDTRLELNFTIGSSGTARAYGIEGDWTMTFDKVTN